MKNNQHNPQFAFSLVEISVVVLIIGILIAGISKGADLYQDFRLTTARKLTLNSRVGRIPNLEIWFETTLENSLASGTTTYTNLAKPAESTPIGRWNDLNPNIIFNSRNHATQTNLANQPTYIKNGINNLPSLNFDGSNDHFFYNGNFFINSDYTVFVIEERKSNKDNNFFLCGQEGEADKNIAMGYRLSESNNTILLGQWLYDVAKSIPTYSSPVSRMHSFVFSKNIGTPYTGKTIYTNGGGKVQNNNPNYAIPITSYNGSSIGNIVNLDFYEGYISEIIMFSRALNDNERREIEEYLSQKWSIRLEN